ncbi:MAG: DNA-binding protein [Desulfurococcaceae archaeon]
MNVLVLPIKPLFAYRIFTGMKRFELRKLTCKRDIVGSGDRAVVYVTGGVKAFMGEFTVGDVIFGDPVYISKVLSRIKDSGVGELDLKYINSVKCAVAIEVRDPLVYKTPIEMKQVLRIFPDYIPPRGIQILDTYDPLVVLVFNKARERSLCKN